MTTITSQPEKIEVLLDGRSRGKTPLELQERYPGLRSLEWIPPPPETPGGTLAPRVVQRANLRPAPPGWLFPFDFPLDLAMGFLPRKDPVLEATLVPPEEGLVVAPTQTEITGMARRAKAFRLISPR